VPRLEVLEDRALLSGSATIATVAGTGTAGYSGDGGQAMAATLRRPFSVAVDAAGDLFIADDRNNVVRKVDTNGVITTVAGNGAAGHTGDGGPATAATLNNPVGLAVDAAGDLFIADAGNNVVRKVGTNGVITTVAGTGVSGVSGDGGPATAATLNGPQGVAVDAAGDLFIADAGNNVVRKVAPGGVITTFAGTGVASYSGDGGPATAATLDFPEGVAVGSAGNLFVADTDNSVVRRITTPQQQLTTTIDQTVYYTILYGGGGNPDGTTTFLGHIADTSGSMVPQGNATVAVTFNNITKQAPIDPSTGLFEATFDTSSLGVANSPYTVSYHFDATTDFSAADQTSELTVNPRPITITPDALSKPYGTLDPTLTYTITAGSLVAGDTVVLTRAPGELVGLYPITVGGTVAGRNYALTATPVNFQITAPPTITTQIASNFDGTAIAAGNTIWFNSVASFKGVDLTHGTSFVFLNGTISFDYTSAGVPKHAQLTVPATYITFSPTATQASTTFDSTANAWQTVVPANTRQNVFLGGLAYLVPSTIDGGSVKSITWSGSFWSSTAGASMTWKWAAAVYNTVQYPQLFADLNAIAVQPVDGDNGSSDHAGTPEGIVMGHPVKNQVIGGARGGGGSNATGGYSGTTSVTQ
jgi:hypothetical protein